MHSKKATTWLLFQGWEPTIIIDLPSLDASTFDEIATPDYPVLVLNQALHSGWLNTKELEVCNITKDTPDPDGGKFVKDANGYPTGMIKEGPAIEYVIKRIKDPNIAFAAVTNIFGILKQYAQKVITDKAASLLSLSFVTHLPPCPVRIGVFYNAVNTKEKPSDFFTNKKLWFPGAKVWADGSPYAGSMAKKEPYLDTDMTRALDFDEKNYPCGYLIYKCAEDQAKVLQAFKNEILATHCHGERAIDQSHEPYKKISKPTRTLWFNHRRSTSMCY